VHNHVFKVGVQFLGRGYYYPSTEKIRQVYPVWCNRLHNHSIHQKATWKYGVVQILGVWTFPPPQWLHPWYELFNTRLRLKRANSIRSGRGLRQWKIGLQKIFLMRVFTAIATSSLVYSCGAFICNFCSNRTDHANPQMLVSYFEFVTTDATKYLDCSWKCTKMRLAAWLCTDLLEDLLAEPCDLYCLSICLSVCLSVCQWWF